MAKKESGKGSGGKMTLVELKRHLRGLTQEECVDLVCRLYKSGPDAVQLLNAEFNRESYTVELYQETKEKISRGVLPKRGKPSLRDAKAAISAFQKVCQDPAQVLDVQIYYVECGMKLAGEYGELYDAFYTSMGNMFETIVDTLVKQDREDLFRQVEERLRKLVEDAKNTDGFRDEFSAFYDLPWVMDKEEEPTLPDVDPAVGACLLPQNAQRFFSLMMPLQNWLNRKFQIVPELGDTFTQKDVKMDQLGKLMEYLWTHPREIDNYLAERGEALSGADREQVADWKKFIRGRFVIERYLKGGAIFLPTDDSETAYLVSGITNEIEEGLPRYALPLAVQATLIPFMGRIIYDGILAMYSVSFGGGLKRSMKDSYMRAKKAGRIISKL